MATSVPNNWGSVTPTQRINYKMKVKDYIKGVLLSEPCKYCGEKDPVVKQFHHRRPEEKMFNIGNAWHTQGMESVVVEMDKCDVVCANCHLKIHAGTIGESK